MKFLFLSAIGCLATAACSSVDPTLESALESRPLEPALRVVRAQNDLPQLVDENGQRTRMLGVNHSGGEFACLSGNGAMVFSSRLSVAEIADLKARGVNTVRFGINSHCWLGATGSSALPDPSDYAALGPRSLDATLYSTPYRSGIVQFANDLLDAGIYPMVEVHWNSPEPQARATGQQPMLDAHYSWALWKSLAATFRNAPGVVFDLYNEPHLEAATTDPWACWLHGCTVRANDVGWTRWNRDVNPVTSSKARRNFDAAGVLPIIQMIRDEVGAENVIVLSGLSYAQDLSGWLGAVQSIPEPYQRNLVAGFHTYERHPVFSFLCTDETCRNDVLLPVAQAFPLVVAEVGQFDCASDYAEEVMAWADEAFDCQGTNVSYLGWTYNRDFDCKLGPSLVGQGGALTAFGEGFFRHLKSPSVAECKRPSLPGFGLPGLPS